LHKVKKKIKAATIPAHTSYYRSIKFSLNYLLILE